MGAKILEENEEGEEERGEEREEEREGRMALTLSELAVRFDGSLNLVPPLPSRPAPDPVDHLTPTLYVPGGGTSAR
jgi:hypothetical protein